MTTSIRVRFAPSPTGHLHIGGLRAAVFNWLFARHNYGAYLLRIEDTDLERSKPEYTQAILDAFNWTNILPDEPIVIQSSRKPEHDAVAARLLEEGKAYRCYCTQEEVVQRYTKAHNDEHVKYDGLCRSRTEPPYPGAPFAIRFKIPDHLETIDFTDLIRGHVSFLIDQFDDFIIVRSDGTPMYNFVVVIDDAFMRISHVIRGEDHISNTPKQIMLYQACGYQLPHFAHLPMVLGSSGERLSKRDAATSVLDYRIEGYLPDALINYLVRLGWAHGDQELFTRQEMIDLFKLEDVGKKGAIFSMDKLQWINSQYMQAMTPAALLNYMATTFGIDYQKHYPTWNQAQIEETIHAYQTRVVTVKELQQRLDRLYQGPRANEYYASAWAQWITPQTKEYITELISALQTIPFYAHDELTTMCKDLSKRFKIKLVVLAQPIRIALTGTSDGPSVFDLMTIVGKETCIARLNALCATISQLQG